MCSFGGLITSRERCVSGGGLITAYGKQHSSGGCWRDNEVSGNMGD